MYIHKGPYLRMFTAVLFVKGVSWGSLSIHHEGDGYAKGGGTLGIN